MTIKTEKLNSIYEAYNHLFINSHPSFHNLLWQIIINEAPHEKAAFAVIYSEGQLEIVIALDNGGYIPTGVFFRDISYYDSCNYADLISARVFTLSDPEVQAITIHSIQRSKNS